jgi:hypothetical protein
MPIKEGKRGGKPVYSVYSVSGKLLGSASTSAAVEKMRDKFALKDCLT